MKIIREEALHAEDVHSMMLDVMENPLSLKTEDYRSTTAATFNLLLKAVAEGRKAAVWRRCVRIAAGGVASNILREQLNTALAVCQLRQQEAELNVGLAAASLTGMPHGGLEVALDTHDEPFYGKTPELLTYTCLGQAKAGTTHFFRIASAYVIWREVRLTLALTYVLPEDDLQQVVERLLHRLGQLGVHATVL